MKIRGILYRVFSWAGVLMAVCAVVNNLAATNTREAAMIQGVAFGVASLACFRAGEFFK